MNNLPKLGIDIGRVIIDGSSHPEGGDTAFFQGDRATMLRTPAMDGAFKAIAKLTVLFEGRVWLVSKCGPRVQRRSQDWLQQRGFFDRTGVDAQDIRFCITREGKAPIAQELGLTHFIDDRVDVLTHLEGIVPNRYLFGPQRASIPGGLVHVPDWWKTEAAVRAGFTG